MPEKKKIIKNDIKKVFMMKAKCEKGNGNRIQKS